MIAVHVAMLPCLIMVRVFGWLVLLGQHSWRDQSATTIHPGPQRMHAVDRQAQLWTVTPQSSCEEIWLSRRRAQMITGW
jgi:hypothetical protein